MTSSPVKKNVLFSQVKTSPLLWPLWLLCYESPLSQQKIIFKWYNIFLNIFQKHFEKYFTRSLGSIVKFRISARPCNTLHFLICNNSIASSNKLSVEIEKMFFFLISLLIDHFDYFHEPEYLNKLWGCHFFSIFKLWCITSATHHSHIHFDLSNGLLRNRKAITCWYSKLCSLASQDNIKTLIPRL